MKIKLTADEIEAGTKVWSDAARAAAIAARQGHSGGKQPSGNFVARKVPKKVEAPKNPKVGDRTSEGIIVHVAENAHVIKPDNSERHIIRRNDGSLHGITIPGTSHRENAIHEADHLRTSYQEQRDTAELYSRWADEDSKKPGGGTGRMAEGAVTAHTEAARHASNSTDREHHLSQAERYRTMTKR